jgi:hypothetical protein
MVGVQNLSMHVTGKRAIFPQMLAEIREDFKDADLQYLVVDLHPRNPVDNLDLKFFTNIFPRKKDNHLERAMPVFYVPKSSMFWRNTAKK